ncbi:MAG: class I SAM-dependent methyltransferase family protein [Archaeoglobi archaeon]|nr:class I SAM-dependent methyltransferase family protein [Candidatus Mnemosynella bozhongmuii]
MSSRGARILSNFCSIPPEKLPKGWQILGDVIMVKVSEEHKREVGEALLRMYPRAKTVLRYLGLKGDMRESVVEVIAGSGETETIVRENGCLYMLDASKIMFSKGNVEERRRMSRVGENEEIVDMFAGVGHLSIPIAVHSRPKRILAIEINPVAYEYLKRNIELNGIRCMEAILGDCSQVTPEGEFDRVIMGHIYLARRFLSKGIRALKEEGGILHFHDVARDSSEPVEILRRECEREGRRARILEVRKVKSYAPRRYHYVVDAEIR